MNKMMYRIVSIAFLMMLVSCTFKKEQQVSEVQNKKSGQPRVALIVKSLANEFFNGMVTAAQKYQQTEANFELISNGTKDESDLGQQINLVEQMIAQKVNAIVLAPADSKALIPVVKRAVDQGIVVINIDNKLDDGVLKSMNLKVPFVGPDNQEGALKVGRVLAKQLKKDDEVAILTGVQTAFNAQERQRGFETAMRESGMKIVSTQSADWETAKANVVASAILNEHPKLKAILASNDNMALGAYSAVQAAGKSKKIEIVGFDAISAVTKMVQEGSILATADQHADQLGIFGLKAALSILNGSASADFDAKHTPIDVIVKDGATPKQGS